MLSEEGKLALINSCIEKLRSDPDGIMGEFDPDQFVFKSDPRSTNGKWADRTMRKVRNVRVIGVMESSYIGPYADMEGAPEAEFTGPRIAKSKVKFNVAMPSRSQLGGPAKDSVTEQFKNLYLIEATHEGDPTPEDLARDPTLEVEKDYTVNSFVKNGPGSGSLPQICVVTDPLFQREKVGRAHTMGMLFNKSPVEAVEASMPVTDTLATWPDPLGRFARIVRQHEYKINTDINALDVNGNRVHPSKLESIFCRGVWVEVDMVLVLWDYSKPKGPPPSPPARAPALSKTYQCRLRQIRALTEPPVLNAVDHVSPSASKKRRLADLDDVPLELPALRPFVSEGVQSVSATANAVDTPSPASTAASETSSSSSTLSAGEPVPTSAGPSHSSSGSASTATSRGSKRLTKKERERAGDDIEMA